MEDLKYGTLLNRIKAIFIDGLVLTSFAIGASLIFSKFDHVNNLTRTIVFVFIFLLYDPIFTSLFGATIGHFVIGLRVRKDNDETNKIIFPVAIIRYIVKVTLGWISLLTVTGSKKSKAIHDSLVGSVVLQA
jgi:uncharacterized RDD family membrane protein YckC